MYPQWPNLYGYDPLQYSEQSGQGKDELHFIIHQLLKKIDEMERKQKQLQQQIEAIKPITIENINYKIQDLHVEELSGNLSVGLTALSDAEELGEMLRENISNQPENGDRNDPKMEENENIDSEL